MAELLPVVGFTLKVAGGSTLLILLPGILLGWALSRRTWPGRTIVETLVSLPLVIPPTAVGLALLILLGPEGPLPGMDVVFTWRAVVAACAIMSFPLLVQNVRSAFEEVDAELLEVARTLGRGPLRAFVEVQVPMSWRGILGGVVLAFTRALGEFGATIVVAGNIPGKTQTLALALFQNIQVGREREALWVAAVSVLLAFGTMYLVDRLTRSRQRALDS